MTVKLSSTPKLLSFPLGSWKKQNNNYSCGCHSSLTTQSHTAYLTWVDLNDLNRITSPFDTSSFSTSLWFSISASTWPFCGWRYFENIKASQFCLPPNQIQPSSANCITMHQEICSIQTRPIGPILVQWKLMKLRLPDFCLIIRKTFFNLVLNRLGWSLTCQKVWLVPCILYDAIVLPTKHGIVGIGLGLWLQFHAFYILLYTVSLSSKSMKIRSQTFKTTMLVFPRSGTVFNDPIFFGFFLFTFLLGGPFLSLRQQWTFINLTNLETTPNSNSLISSHLIWIHMMFVWCLAWCCLHTSARNHLDSTFGFTIASLDINTQFNFCFKYTWRE